MLDASGPRQLPRQLSWRAVAIGAVIWTLAAAGLWGTQMARTPRGLHASDSYNYAQIGRNLARGDGLVTQEALPYDYLTFDDVPHAEVMHPPLQAVAIAACFALFGVDERAATFPAGAAYLLLAPLVWAAGARLAGPVAGAVAAALLLLEPAAGNLATTALADSLYGLLLTAAVLAVARARVDARGWLALAAGAAFGLADLGRETTRYLLPFALVALWAAPAGRPRRLGAFLCGFLALTLPNLARVALATGSPFTPASVLMIDMHPFAELSWYRSLSPLDPVGYVMTKPMALEAKLTLNAGLLWRGLHTSVSFVAVLLGAAAWRWGRHPAVRAVAGLTALALLLQIGVSLAFRVDFRHYAPLVGLLALLSGVGAVALWDRFRWIGAVAALLGVGLVALADGGVRVRQMQPPSEAYEVELRSNRALGEWAGEHTGPDDLVITDVSEVVAWHADRRTVWYPLTVPLLDRIPRRPGETHWLLLSSIGLTRRPDVWAQFLTTDAVPPRFEKVADYRDDRVSARLFRRTDPRVAD